MKLRDKKSIFVLVIYFISNISIVVMSFILKPLPSETQGAKKSIAPEFTEIESLDYFNLLQGLPQMSLSALKMRSQGEAVAEFDSPNGVYFSAEKKEKINYEAQFGIYRKKKQTLLLEGGVKFLSEKSKLHGDKLKYYFIKDLVSGSGNIKFEGDDLKSKDHVVIFSDKVRSHPKAQFSTFSGNVHGSLLRKKKYEGEIIFRSAIMEFDGLNSLSHLEGDVHLKREAYDITSGKADIYLENFNKSLKYFVLNDDVKVTEKLVTPQGVQLRKAFSERLEGFGQDHRMVLSGAPRVEMGKDVIKGYRITIREKIDLIEVDDALSDVQVKREKLKD